MDTSGINVFLFSNFKYINSTIFYDTNRLRDCPPSGGGSSQNSEYYPFAISTGPICPDVET